MTDFSERNVAFWLEHLGDFTLLGWTITFAYVLVFGLAWAVLRRGAEKGPGLGSRKETWRSIRVVVAVLGFNKQLDFQTLILAFGRQLDFWLASRGWFPRRGVFLVLVLLFVLVFVLTAWWVARRLPRPLSQVVWEVAGLATLLAFLIVRSPLGGVLEPFGPTRWFVEHPHTLELAALVLLAAAAVRILRNPARASRSD